jgi:hypothetical protein
VRRPAYALSAALVAGCTGGECTNTGNLHLERGDPAQMAGEHGPITLEQSSSLPELATLLKATRTSESAEFQTRPARGGPAIRSLRPRGTPYDLWHVRLCRD